MAPVGNYVTPASNSTSPPVTSPTPSNNSLAAPVIGGAVAFLTKTVLEEGIEKFSSFKYEKSMAAAEIEAFERGLNQDEQHLRDNRGDYRRESRRSCETKIQSRKDEADGLRGELKKFKEQSTFLYMISPGSRTRLSGVTQRAKQQDENRERSRRLRHDRQVARKRINPDFDPELTD